MADAPCAPKHPRDMTPAERAAGIRQIERDRVAARNAAADALKAAADKESELAAAAAVATGSTSKIPQPPKEIAGKHPRQMTHAERAAALRILSR